MKRSEIVHRLKFLYDQVHQTAERIEHLPASMPMHVHPESLNYGQDLSRLKEEYNNLAVTSGMSGEELEAEGLPQRF